MMQQQVSLAVTFGFKIQDEHGNVVAVRNDTVPLTISLPLPTIAEVDLVRARLSFTRDGIEEQLQELDHLEEVLRTPERASGGGADSSSPAGTGDGSAGSPPGSSTC